MPAAFRGTPQEPPGQRGTPSAPLLFQQRELPTAPCEGKRPSWLGEHRGGRTEPPPLRARRSVPAPPGLSPGRCPSPCAHGMAAASRGSCWAPTATRGASPSLFFSEPVCGRGTWGEESRSRGCVAAVAVRPSSLRAGLGSASPSCDASASSSSPNREQKCLSHTSASPPAAAAAPLASRALPPGPAAAPGAGAPPAGF